ncbi:4-hydroxyphenylacetate 3-hydroxylase family protein [Marinisporobacter balticus]|uniref:Vinylacetyl-CoA delta-isomerase /4-hydroxybutyryl-CoA dehydratase n=1 Tax=Marinisporobacter balticus TaxID=2018667 RepID=A0A4R2LJH5_9FIRM|nr:4-hydroxyphenylacetate 3-hydroxylase family protein [Marinisporobacter balticus]TCO79525.1 vinylacetyl-CoA delta-isomerase /4-hydroxybutyryl-CoA dehydratase [Marinisporobacter balticus]
MALMTKEQYLDSLRKLNVKVYMFGELVENFVDHPIIRPSINAVGMTYDLAHDPQYEDLMTATSNLTGEKVNRFTHLHQNTDDLRKKVKMLRLLGQKTATCFQRCVGMDSFNAVYSTTFEIDQAHGTKYHENFKKYLEYVQANDLTVDGAMTDPKGNRGLAPSKQADPDLFLRIVEQREDGIVVRGAKAHQTGSINSHEHLIMPTMAMREGDESYAVSFAIPTDAEGIFMIYGRQSCDTRKLEEDADVDLGNKEFGGQEALVVFDDVFIPNDRIFLNGEVEFAGMLVERFAGYHRQSYGGCKVGVGDVLIGAAAVAADFNGAAKATHVKDKLIEMTHLNETLYCCGIACSAEGYPTEAGNYQIDLLLANICKQNVTRFPYEITRLAEDIAGGLMVTMPSEKDFKHPKLGPICEKYFKGVDDVPTEHRMRILRLVENMTLGTAAVGYRTESMHGAGSPQAQRIMIARQGNLAHKKELAKKIARIDEASIAQREAAAAKK